MLYRRRDVAHGEVVTVHLAKFVLADMTERGTGKVLLTSSIAAMMPGSFQTMYNASKSFIQSFAEALHDEMQEADVHSRQQSSIEVSESDTFRDVASGQHGGTNGALRPA